MCCYVRADTSQGDRNRTQERVREWKTCDEKKWNDDDDKKREYTMSARDQQLLTLIFIHVFIYVASSSNWVSSERERARSRSQTYRSVFDVWVPFLPFKLFSVHLIATFRACTLLTLRSDFNEPCIFYAYIPFQPYTHTHTREPNPRTRDSKAHLLCCASLYRFFFFCFRCG